MKVMNKTINYCNTLCCWLYIDNCRRPTALVLSSTKNITVVEVMFIKNCDNVGHIVVYGRNIIMKNISQPNFL